MAKFLPVDINGIANDVQNSAPNTAYRRSSSKGTKTAGKQQQQQLNLNEIITGVMKCGVRVYARYGYAWCRNCP